MVKSFLKISQPTFLGLMSLAFEDNLLEAKGWGNEEG